MATSVLEQPSEEARAHSAGLGRALALDATIPAVLFASAAIVIGLHWDISWHRAIGRDTFWSPPHVLEQVAASMAGLFCGWRVIYTSFLGTDADRTAAVRFWGVFYGPLGGWVCIWGTIAMISSAPFDDWWHNAYGLDVEILTPPHVWLLVGMVTVQLGAMLMMLAGQNRSAVARDATGAMSGAGATRYAAIFAASMGLIVLMAATMVFEYTGVPNMHHSPLFYQISAGIFPLLLLAVARAGGGRYPATIAAATYSVIMLVMSWVLALVPAVPLLAPIYNQITTLIPPGFPILLIVPAVAIDLLHRRLAGRSDWILAACAGVAFVVVLLVIQWPFASFLLTLDQPNYLFGTGYWEYNARLGPWTYVFFDVPGYTWNEREMVGQLDVAAMARALGVAMGIAVAASRLGTWWGDWMRRVRR